MKDLVNDLALSVGVQGSTSDNTAVATGVIDGGQAAAVLFAVVTGTIADADATFTVLVQAGDESDGSDLATVGTDELIGLDANPSAAHFDFSDDGAFVAKFQYIGAKRYLKVTVTPANNASAAEIDIYVIRSGLRKLPAS